MKLYHYVLRPNDVLKKGLYSFSAHKNADLSYYIKRSNAKTHDEVCQWMESCFEGRSRGVRAFTEPIKYTKNSIHCLKDFADKCDLFEIDVESLNKDGLIEAVYVSPSVLELQHFNKNIVDEILYKINGVEKIDFSPIDWSVCDDKLQRRFAFVRYYLLIIKGGIIDAKYLKKINNFL